MIETRGWMSKRQMRCPRRRGRCVRSYGGLGPQQVPVEVALTLLSISRLYESTEAALSLIRLPVPVW